jgi:hypothetical protein
MLNRTVDFLSCALNAVFRNMTNREIKKARNKNMALIF